LRGILGEWCGLRRGGAIASCSRYDPDMFLKVFGLPLLILAVAVIYWFSSYEPAGSAMLAIFAIAMAVMGWALVPTVNDVGPVAPVDESWHERGA
jgi:hypothetical protein